MMTRLQENIFEPLGMKNITLKPQTGIQDGGVLPRLAGMNFKETQGDATTARPQQHVIEQDENQIEILYGGAGAYGNAAEYVQILVALMNDGTHPITKAEILKPASVEELFRDQLSDDVVKDLDRPIEGMMPELSNS